jgi:hypothetical protein
MSTTTEIQNYSGRLWQVTAAQPTDSLADIVGSLSGTPLLLWNSEQAVKPPVPAQRQVGRKAWTVFSRDETDLAQRVTALEASVAVLNADALLYGRAFLRNSASEILLFALKRQPRPPHTTDYFTSLATNGSAELSTMVASLNQTLVAPTTEAGLAGMLDSVIERRNGTIHYANRQMLETNALGPARDLLSRHPQLRLACPQEVLVIDNYDTFQTAFGF